MLLKLLFLNFSSFIYRVARAGISVIATKSDAMSVTVNVIGSVFINSQIIPLTINIGRNANIVVELDETIAHLNVSIASIAESLLEYPLDMFV